MHAAGVHLVSTDEKTGIQALERKAPTLPMRPGLVERREFEYIRHGTRCLTVNFEVATGRIVAPTVGPTRTEADFAAHITQTVMTDPTGEWVFIVDQLNTHKSETLVRWVAAQCDIETDLGRVRELGTGIDAQASDRGRGVDDDGVVEDAADPPGSVPDGAV